MQDTQEAGSGTVAIGRWPLVATVALVVVLLNLDRVGAERLPFFDSLFVSIVVVLLPILGFIQAKFFPELKVERSEAYKSSMATTAVLATCAMALAYFRFGWSGMGLGPISPGQLAVWSIGLTAAGMAVMFAFLGLRLALKLEETPFLDLMLPETSEERWLFVGVSFAAGIGEELVYRGYLLPLFWDLFPGVWPATLFVAVLFGLVHSYQGWFGVLRTALLGLMLSLSMIWAGTLWPAIIAHVVIDLLGGLVFARVLMTSSTPVPATD